MASELKACPFCGGDNIAYVVGAAAEYITCDDCLADGPAKRTQEEAHDAWNIRATPSAEQPVESVDARAWSLIERIARREPWQEHYGHTWEEEAAEIVASRPDGSVEVGAWIPIAQAEARTRYMGAFKAPLCDAFEIVGLGTVRKGVFTDHLGQWEPVDRVYSLPPADLLATRPSTASEVTGEALFRAFMAGDTNRLTTTALPSEWPSMKPSYQHAWDDLAAALSGQESRS